MRNAKQAKDVWAKIVAEVDAGESPGAVATRHGVREGTLRWWRSRLKNGANSHRQEAPAVRTGLLPIFVDPRASGEVEVVVGVCRATFPMGTPIAYVKQLLAVLRLC